MTTLGLLRSTSATSLLLLTTTLSACVIQVSDGDTDTDDPPTTSGTTGDPSTGDDTTTGDPTATSADSGTTTTATDATATDGTTTDGTATGTGPVGLSFELDIQPILDEHCVTACHSAGGEWSFLLLSPGDAYDSIVGVMSTQTALAFIEPGDPDASYLWHKISGTQANAGGGGLDMPKGMGAMEPTVLTPEQFSTIEMWIQQGALP